MAITNSDIQLYQAQNNTDDPNGGGSRTNTVVPDGEVNNLFPDISRLDSVSGNVSLRKVFPLVNTNNRDVYQGAHAMIRKDPADARVEAFLFHTDDPNDVRSDAVNEIESYVTATNEARFYPFGTQSQGSSTISVLQQLSDPVPVVGNVYQIRTSSGDAVNQYVRVSGVQSSQIVITEGVTNFTRRNVILTIEQPLQFEFVGSTSPGGRNIGDASMFETAQSSTSRFYGVKSLAAEAVAGATSVNVGNVNGQLVPASSQRTPITNAPIFSEAPILLTNEDTTTDFFNLSGFANDVENTLPTPVTPGTFRLLSSSTGLRDNGEGRLISNTDTSGNIGTINYNAGTFLVFSSEFNITSSFRFTYAPATSIAGFADRTTRINITNQNQSNVYIETLTGVPVNGSLSISYRANNQVQNILSDEQGNVGGVGQPGNATVTDNGNGTATVNMTLALQPDIGSSIIISYAINRFDNVSDEHATGMLYKQLDHTRINPNSFNVRVAFTVYTADSRGVIAIDDGRNGYIDQETGELFFPLFQSPYGNSTIQYNYDYASAEPDESTDADLVTSTATSGGTIQNLGLEDVASLRVTATVNFGVSGGSTPDQTITLYVDENNILRSQNDGLSYGSVTFGAAIGDFSQRITGITVTAPNVTRGGSSVPLFRLVNNTVTFTFRQKAIPTPNYDQSASFSELTSNSDLLIVLPRNIIGNFTFRSAISDDTSNTHIKVINGVAMFRNGTTAGSYDPSTGRFLLFRLPTSTSDFPINTGRINGAYINYFAGLSGISEVNFRPAANNIDPTTLTTNLGGITVVNQASFEVRITGLTNADPAAAFYNAVSITTLPLNPELLGINPIRLPTNGQVPLFGAGYTCVVFEEMSTDVTGTPTAGQTINLGRTGQVYMEVVDVNGARLAYNQYTTDRTAGTLTFANPLSLVDRNGDALTAPFTIIDRYEDMLLCVGTTATGDINLSGGLSRTYSTNARISSALIFGDLGAALTLSFSQQTFDVWSDERTTGEIAAQYNFTNFPLQVVNANAITGRWAIQFVTNTTVNVREETLGVIATDLPISSDIAPLNPTTGQPYFTISSGGWGSGWVTSNVLRFNTRGGAADMWIIRTVQSGALTEDTDSIDVEIRGDV